MKIGISGFAADGGKSGISQYMINVLQRLPRLDPAVRCVIFVPAAASTPCSSGAVPQRDRQHARLDGPPGRPASSGTCCCYPCCSAPRLRLRLAAGRQPPPRVWYGVPSVSHGSRPVPAARAGEVRPAAHVLHPARAADMMRRLTGRGTVSESTRRDLEQYPGCRRSALGRLQWRGPQRLRAGARPRTGQRNHRRCHGHRRTLHPLYRAPGAPRQEPRAPAEALALLKRRGQLSHKLVLAGSRWNGAEAIDASIAQLGLTDDVILTGFVENRLLPELYAAADLFVVSLAVRGLRHPAAGGDGRGHPGMCRRRLQHPRGGRRRRAAVRPA